MKKIIVLIWGLLSWGFCFGQIPIITTPDSSGLLMVPFSEDGPLLFYPEATLLDPVFGIQPKHQIAIHENWLVVNNTYHIPNNEYHLGGLQGFVTITFCNEGFTVLSQQVHLFSKRLDRFALKKTGETTYTWFLRSPKTIPLLPNGQDTVSVNGSIFKKNKLDLYEKK